MVETNAMDMVITAICSDGFRWATIKGNKLLSWRSPRCIFIPILTSSPHVTKEVGPAKSDVVRPPLAFPFVSSKGREQTISMTGVDMWSSHS